MVKFEGKAEEKELGCKRHKEIKSWSRLEEGVWGYDEHIRTGVLDVKSLGF